MPAGLCIAIIGVALSLINFGIDEYVNPRLRSAGERARAMKKKARRERAGHGRALRPLPTTDTTDTTTQNTK